MLKNMKIGTQIITASFLLVVAAVLCTAFTAVHFFSNYMYETAATDARTSLNGFANTLEQEFEAAQRFRDQLAGTEQLAYFLKQGDTVAINREAKKLMDAAGVDIVTFIAKDGTVVARPHAPERFGDNVGNEEDVRKGLSGSSYEIIMGAASTALGYYCGTPLRYNGELVGMVRTAISFEDPMLVDNVKKLFAVEATIFGGKTRINTTLKEGDRRLVGTDAADAVARTVLQEGGHYTSEIKLFGTPYLADYMPLKDPGTGKILGMLFTGKSLEAMYSAMRTTSLVILVVSAIILFTAFFFSLWLARRISKPLNQIVRISERGSQGDLTITRKDFQYNGGGELKTLVDSLDAMITSQATAMNEIIETSGEISGQADALSTLSDRNSDAITQTKKLIDEVTHLCGDNSEAVGRGTSAISEMAQGANSVAQMSVESAAALAKTTQISRDAVQSVNDLAENIGTVDVKTTDNQQKIRDLSKSVSEISNFMDVISSIADQTNLLALNAAIEAARAGEAGRGFAVVAEEVRKLAEESRNASKSVEELVSVLNKNAGEAIDATEDSVRIVKSIMEMAENTVTGLNGALKEITSANEAIQSIAAVAEEQAAASAEITNVINSINDSTRLIEEKMENLNDLSEQTASLGISVSTSAEDMAQYADNMRKALAHFKVAPRALRA